MSNSPYNILGSWALKVDKLTVGQLKAALAIVLDDVYVMTYVQRDQYDYNPVMGHCQTIQYTQHYSGINVLEIS